MMKLISFSAVFLLLGASDISASPTWEYTPERDAVGRIYFYERSNTDGTLDERITVFRRSTDKIEVYKSVNRCYGAALVQAKLDFETFSASRLVSGRLQPDAGATEIAFLDWDRDAGQLNLRVELPDRQLRHDAPVERAPWHLFDFDLGSLTVMTPHLADPRRDFEFGMALIWPDENLPNPMTWMGDVHASYAGAETRGDVPASVYVLSGSAFTGDLATGPEGRLWLHEDDGHIVDAIFPAPNHPGYKDFRLRLIRISDGGADEWERLLRAHYEGC